MHVVSDSSMILATSSWLQTRRAFVRRKPNRSASLQQAFSGYVVNAWSCCTTNAPSFLGILVDLTMLNAFSDQTQCWRGDREREFSNTMGMGLLYECDSSPFADLGSSDSGVLGALYEAMARNYLRGECCLFAQHQ